jgi:hypothetical protein
MSGASATPNESETTSAGDGSSADAPASADLQEHSTPLTAPPKESLARRLFSIANFFSEDARADRFGRRSQAGERLPRSTPLLPRSWRRASMTEHSLVHPISPPATELDPKAPS